MATLFMVLGLTAVADADELPTLTPGEASTGHALAQNSSVLTQWEFMTDGCPFEPGVLHRLTDLKPQIPAEFRETALVQDGWGQPFRVWCSEEGWGLVSFGADGLPGLDYSTLPREGDAGDDFFVTDGFGGSLPVHVATLAEVGKMRRTMADIRSLSICFEAYKIDNGSYPGATGAELREIVELNPVFAPVYIRVMPLRDPWGNPFMYWTDGASYRIVSRGQKGEYDADYVSTTGLGEQGPLEYEKDIVIADGRFEQWPGLPETQTGQ